MSFFMKKRLYITTRILTIWCLLVGLVACGQKKQSYDEMLGSLLNYSVDTISPRFVNQDFLILDTREIEEYEVSHLRGAVHVGYDDLDLSRLAKEKKSQKILVYCTVGYRSEKVGEKLKELGFTSVYNLYGGIFSWVSEEREVVDVNDKLTKKVHTYDEEWGEWLSKIRGK